MRWMVFLSGFYPSVAAFSVDPFERFEVFRVSTFGILHSRLMEVEGMHVLHENYL